MRITASTLALLALPALIHADAVSLIDFVPRVDNVSGNCNKVYEQHITGCDSQDFKQQSCSVACVKALDSMTKLVKDACSNEGFMKNNDNKSNILALFLQDLGPQNLCQNAQEVLQSQSNSPAAPTTSAEHSSTATPTQFSTLSVVSSTSTASSTDVPTSLAVDTSSSPEPTTSTSSKTSAESSQSTTSSTSSKSSQIFEAPSMPASFTTTSTSSESTAGSEHSGGGSPFDLAGSQFSSATATASSAVFLMLAITLTAFAAQW
jgi:hypothetical protein